MFTKSIIMRGFLIILSIAVSFVCTSAQKGNTCGEKFTLPSGIIKFGKKSSTIDIGYEGSCEWRIKLNQTTIARNELFLSFEDFYLGSKDLVKIELVTKENETDKRIEILKFVNAKEPFGVLIEIPENETLVVTLQAKAVVQGTQRMISFYYSTGCVYTTALAKSQTYKSPIYFGDSMNDLNCTFSFSTQDAKETSRLLARFSQWNLVDGYIDVSGLLKNDELKYPPFRFNSTTELFELIEDKNPLTFNFILSNKSIAENFTIIFEHISPICSDYLKLSEDDKTSSAQTPPIDVMTYFAERSLKCIWVIYCTEPHHVIKIDFISLNLTSTGDQFTILDGDLPNSPVLAQATMGKENEVLDNYIISSTSHLRILFNAPYAYENLNISFDAKQIDNQGHLVGQGNLTFDGDSVYLLEVDETMQVEIEITNSTTFTSMSLFSSFSKSAKPFENLESGKVYYPIVSPGNLMAVVTKGGKGSATFKGIIKGCVAYASGNGGTYSVAGHKNERCTWKIPSSQQNSSDLISLHFSELNLESTDALTVSKLNKDKTVLAKITSEQIQIPDLEIPASDGAFLELVRGDGKEDKVVLQASYQIKQACNFVLNAKLNQSLDITSPNYPDSYPLQAICNWTINLPFANSSFLLSFEELNLAMEGHSLTISTLNGTTKKELATYNSLTTTLPNDLLIQQNITIDFESISKTLTQINSSHGFKLVVIPLDSGVMIKNDSGLVATPSYPAKINQSYTSVWIVSVNSDNKTRNIIKVEKDNQTMGFDGVLSIFDGLSIRDGKANSSNSSFLSRTDTLIFKYQHLNLTAPGPGIKFSFKAFACNVSLLCDNGICMHDDWICNGFNDCGDYSDEKNCQKAPPSPPTPGPTPEPSPGTSTTALAMGILAALVIGILLGLAGPIAYRRVRGNNFSAYSNFSNAPE